MSNSTMAEAPAGEILAAVRAGLLALTTAPLPAENGARLALIKELRSVAGQAQSLTSVWLAMAEEHRVAAREVGTNVTDWLVADGNADPKEAAGWLKAGQALLGNQELERAALAGEVTPEQGRAIGRALGELPDELTAEERTRATAVLIHDAESMTPRELGKRAAAVLEEVAPAKVPSREDEAAFLEAQRKRAVKRRRLSFFSEDGSMIINANIPVLEGEMFTTVLDAFVASGRAAGEDQRDYRDQGQRYADAFMELTRRFRPDEMFTTRTRFQMQGAQGRAVGDTGHSGTPGPARAGGTGGVVVSGMGASAHSPFDSGRGGKYVPAPGFAGDRPRINVILNEADLHARAEQAGVLPSGQKISAGELRQLCCDADLIPTVLGSESEILDVGRAERLVAPSMRRSLALRDQGCAFPKCDVEAYRCEAHHIQPWWDGGPTALNNLVLLCKHHHGVVEPPRFWTGPPPDKWRVRINPHTQHPEFHPPDGLRRRPGWVPGNANAHSGTAEPETRLGPDAKPKSDAVLMPDAKPKTGAEPTPDDDQGPCGQPKPNTRVAL